MVQDDGVGHRAITEMYSNKGLTRASQVELSGTQWDGRARGCGPKAGSGRSLPGVVINRSQQVSRSRRRKQRSGSLRDDKEWDWAGRV